MREILFRGKRADNGKTIYGSLVMQEKQCFIDVYKHKANSEYSLFFSHHNYIQVIPETVGQYTGLTDKNGKRIFEGDIVKHYNNSDDGFDIGALYWDETFSQWKRTSIGNFHSRDFTYMMSRSCEYEVIGNIHDNPELFEA